LFNGALYGRQWSVDKTGTTALPVGTGVHLVVPPSTTDHFCYLDGDDAVPGGIAFVPFDLVRNLALAVRDDGDVAVLVDLEKVSFITVGLTTARNNGMAWRRWSFNWLTPRRRGKRHQRKLVLDISLWLSFAGFRTSCACTPLVKS
jgi:hypothetical protein